MTCRVELGELDNQTAELTQRGARVVAFSLDKLEDAQGTQELFKNLIVVSDTERSLVTALDILHAGYAPDGTDANKPTTIVMHDGVVRWIYRSTNLFHRLTISELLKAIDGLPAG